MNNLDERVKKDLESRGEQQNQGLQDEIWDHIESKLFTVEKGEARKMKKKKRIFSLAIATAAALVIAFSLQTDKGAALVKGIKDIFVSEKEVVQSIEGQDEKTDVNLNEGKDAEYIIYIDETRYKMIHENNLDIITTIDPLPEKYPEVSMEIKQVADEKPENLVKKVEEQLTIDFPELREIEKVTEPVEGFLLHGAAGNQADSKIIHTYVISNGKNGSFIITGKYFLEAAEGHGARFHHMLESFEIVP